MEWAPAEKESISSAAPHLNKVVSPPSVTGSNERRTGLAVHQESAYSSADSSSYTKATWALTSPSSVRRSSSTVSSCPGRSLPMSSESVSGPLRKTSGLAPTCTRAFLNSLVAPQPEPPPVSVPSADASSAAAGTLATVALAWANAGGARKMGSTKTSKSSAMATLPSVSRKHTSNCDEVRAMMLARACPCSMHCAASGCCVYTVRANGEPGSGVPNRPMAIEYLPLTLGV